LHNVHVYRSLELQVGVTKFRVLCGGVARELRVCAAHSIAPQDSCPVELRHYGLSVGREATLAIVKQQQSG